MGTLENRRCLVVMCHYVHDFTSMVQAAGSGSGGALCPPEGWSALGGAAACTTGLKPVLDAHSGVHGLTGSAFAAQLDRLCSVMEPTDWPTLYAWLRGTGTIPDRCFLLTFDDGLADHAQTVLPILQGRGLRGVFFVPGAVLTSHELLTAHAVHLLLSRLGDRRLEQELLNYLAERRGKTTEWAASLDRAAAEEMYHYESPARAGLKYLITITLPPDLRAEAVNALFEQHIGSPARWAQHWYLGWDDLVEMRLLGHTIGAHGYRHEPYGRLTPAERRRDLRQVAAVLREGLGPDIRPFSYPYGQCNADTCAACGDAGFAHGFTTERRWVTRGSGVFALPRVDTIDVEAVLEEDMACTPV